MIKTTFRVCAGFLCLAVTAISPVSQPAFADPSAAIGAPAPSQGSASQDSGATPPATLSPATSSPTPSTAVVPLVTAPDTAATAVPPPADAPATLQPIDAARSALAGAAIRRGANNADLAALDELYASKSTPLWISDGAFTERARAVMAEFNKADDYGLDPSAYSVPELPVGPSLADQGNADVRLSIAALTYARHARGGRLDPVSLSAMLDVAPPLRDPKIIAKELVESATPDAVLRGLHPKHPEFEALRQALMASRAPSREAAAAIDPALLVKLPDGKSLKVGASSDDVSLLRQRLKIPLASGGDERRFDADVETALKAFQETQGLRASGRLDKRTRAALNREGEPKVSDPKREIDRLIVNMERWRWLPEHLGSMYVINNVPEFMTRVIKGDQTIFEERIIVGMPTWPTPMLTDSMERIVFNPEWGVPDGIKVKELLPRLKRATPQYGGGFFDELFGGGSSGGGRVLAAYGLKPSINGQPVDANAIDWNRVDIRRYSFVQPAGGQNPLGIVKFMFPNSHDVYMHDTSSRNLFSQSQRALSHGCIRVQNPQTLAKILLAEDKGWSEDQVESQYRGGTNDVTLTTPIPVYLTYFTARPGRDGRIATFADIYGTDGRIMSALTGRPVRFETPRPADDEVADATLDPGPSNNSTAKKSTNKSAPQKRKSGDAPGDLIQNAFSGLLFN